MRPITLRAMARSTSVAGAGWSSGRGSVASTIPLTRLTWRKQSPSTRGMRSFTCTSTSFATWLAATDASVSTPRLMNPCSSGGETCSIATSSGTIPSRNSRGI